MNCFFSQRAGRCHRCQKNVRRVWKRIAAQWKGLRFRACGVSHWRDDAIVAWLDETLNEAYQTV